ncbi:MAG TPA: hypothetical protein VG722_12375, partial [Tepidisphaeraceae bacterium]|nr:hypothetical protein [Tepidisphaeraceae bacterium]
MRIMAVFTLMLACISGCASAGAKVDFRLTHKPIGPAIVGFGACMNPYLYAYPNTKEINARQADDLERKVIALHPQLVRIFYLQEWWDKDTDQGTAKGHPGMRDSLIRTIRLAQKAGAKVLLQFWYDPGHYEHPDLVARKFAETIAELRSKYGLASVQFASIQNEPNENHKDITEAHYIDVYRDLDRALKELHIRDQVQIIGGDLLE